MTTTHLFVELLVIGFGALAWILVCTATFFDFDLSSTNAYLPSLGALLPLLCIAYVLGILVDRVADWIFDRLWDKNQRRSIYGHDAKDKIQYFNDRRTLIVEGPELWQLVEYGRSRLRICRGWTLNALALTTSLIFYCLTGGADSSVRLEICVAILGLGAIFTGLCWFSWFKLNGKEYKKIQRQAKWLRHHRKINSTQSIELSGSLNLKENLEYEPVQEPQP